MGSVKRIILKPDCVPSKFECHNEYERKLAKTSNRKKSDLTPGYQDHDYVKVILLPTFALRYTYNGTLLFVFSD